MKNYVDKTSKELDLFCLCRCPVCGDIIYKGNYMMYFIQKKIHIKYNAGYKDCRYRYVPLKELKDKYGNEPDCPDAIKNSNIKYLPFCTMRCTKTVISWLNKKEPDEYVYKRHYGMISTIVDDDNYKELEEL